MQLPTKVRFCDEALHNAYESLKQGKSDEKELYLNLDKAFHDIEKNGFCGIQIPKRLIPKGYLVKYRIHNLWKYNLPNAWRLLYSIESQHICVVSIIIEWLTHKRYERAFKY
ncbi:hypothetical protein HY486_04630 [Candidatus Woesearchaeota archaeon]|nr:hypothetical protein [Candidatus Woesearchaeota archaeon]